MQQKFIKKSLQQITDYFTRIWNHLYFHWQLKNKTAYTLLVIGVSIVVAIPLLTYELVKYKNNQQDIKCLALNIFHEARSESNAGQRAVASVTLNRVASKRYPNSVCEVVYQKRWDRIRKRYVGQFSWTEFDQPPKLKSKAWHRAWKIAQMAYKERHKIQLKGAIFYHAKHIKPSWARKKKPIARIGKHIFYR